MAPRTGPRGVTNEDVANRAGVTYVYAPETPAQQNQVNQQALLSYVLGGQAPGYGMKYGGFPTAGYGQAAIEGQAFGIADLARQAAQQAAVREAELRAQGEEQIAQVRGQAAEEDRQYRRMARFDQPIQERRAAIKASEQPIQSQYKADIASQVTPYKQIEETLGAYSPSQLAQQIAVSRYGYDPMLAAGLFGGQTDIDYATQVQGLEEAQLRQQGVDTSLSSDEILARTLSPEEFYQYQLDKANAAYQNVYEPDYTQDDIAIYNAYGVMPANDQEREILLDQDFLRIVDESKALLSQSDRAVSPDAVVANIVGKYYRDVGDSPRAQLLDDILSQFSFLVPRLGANLDRDLGV